MKVSGKFISFLISPIEAAGGGRGLLGNISNSSSESSLLKLSLRFTAITVSSCPVSRCFCSGGIFPVILLQHLTQFK